MEDHSSPGTLTGYLRPRKRLCKKQARKQGQAGVQYYTHLHTHTRTCERERERIRKNCAKIIASISSLIGIFSCRFLQYGGCIVLMTVILNYIEQQRLIQLWGRQFTYILLDVINKREECLADSNVTRVPQK